MKCMTDALEIRTEMYGRNDVRVAETLLNIARVLQDWGDVDEVCVFYFWFNYKHFLQD